MNVGKEEGMSNSQINSLSQFFRYFLLIFLNQQDLYNARVFCLFVCLFMFLVSCMNILPTALSLSSSLTAAARAARKGFPTRLYRSLEWTFQHVQLELLLPFSITSFVACQKKRETSFSHQTFIVIQLSLFLETSLYCMYIITALLMS